MLSYAPARPLIARWRVWLPLAILLVALSSMIALGGDRGYFYRWLGAHNQLTAKNLAIARNLSPQHNFRLVNSVSLNEDGGFKYNLYGRFPVGGYALIKTAILPFDGDFAAQIIAARALMLLMFCGAAIFAYLALARIAGNRWIALAAALLAFSALYPLYYADSVAGEAVMDLFGAMLAFHGMAVFVQEGRFRQLLIKTCAALLLGWHVYALILPFALLGFGGEALALVRSNAGGSGGRRARVLSALPALARSRFIALAAGSILFGSALLAINFANEYAVYGGERSFLRLPSVGSMLARLGITDGYANHYGAAPGDFLRQQLHRAGVASAPYAAAALVGAKPDQPPLAPSPRTPFGWIAWGGAAAIAALAAALALVPRRFRLPMASAVLMGFCWALAARGSTFVGFHSHEGLFYVGLPLALWSGALIGARRLLGGRIGGAVAIGAAALAAPALALSAFHAGQIRPDADAAKQAKEVMADMNAISRIASEKRYDISPDAAHMVNDYDRPSRAMNYYLGGSYYRSGPDADYAISRYRNESVGLLTPGNRHLFLYERDDLEGLHRAERSRVEASEPAARSVFDVYLEGREMTYLKSPCSQGADIPAGVFFLRLYPVGAFGPSEYSESRFPFSHYGVEFEGVCMMLVKLPDYPIAGIRTGQYAPERERIWEAAIAPPPSAETVALYENAYQAIASGEPAARSVFDLHLGDGAISYLKQPCSEEDARGRFFLSVHPVDVGDLPPERRETGHESLNFDFIPPNGAAFSDKCMATVQLPDYEIAKIETGQDAPDAGRLWQVSIAPPSAETLAAYESAYRSIASGEPAARSVFDLHLGDGAISYLKQPCSEYDARGRFFLSVHPVDVGDLPPERRELGHESLNFNFEPPHGAVFNGKCMATRQLPDYEIAKIVTGQDARIGGRLWDAEIAVGD